MIDIHDVSGVTGGVAGGPATPPGPDLDVDVAALTGLVAWLGGADGAGRSDAELISQLDALERVKSAVAAAQARVTARFVTSQAEAAARLEEEAAACSAAGDFDGWVTARDAARAKQLPPEPARTSPGETGDHDGVAGDEPDGGWSRSRRRRAAALAAKTGVSAQVGLARHESPARGARLARAAVTLMQDLPCTLAALAGGHLSERRAELVVTGTSHLSPEQRALVDAEVIGAHTPGPGDPASSGCAGWGDREVERRVKACADRLDPHGATERARRAREDRRVSVKPVPDCMALVSALLPVEMAVAIFAALQQAAAAKAAGDPRTRGQVMADAMYQRVTGQTSVADDLGIEVQVVITDRALFDGDDTPAHVPGYGPVPAGWVRDRLTTDLHDQHPEPPSHTGTSSAGTSGAGTTGPPGGSAPPGTSRAPETGPPSGSTTADPPSPADAGADLPGARAAKRWLRRLYTHPGTGTLVAMDSTRRLFPAGLRRFLITRDGYCRTPWCDAPIGHADHVHPHAAGGPTSDTNGQGLSVGCNLTKDLPGWHAEVTDPGPTAGSEHPHTVQITTPTGHTYTSTAPPLLPGLIEPDRDTTEFELNATAGHDEEAAAAVTPDTDTPAAVVIELYRPHAHSPLALSPLELTLAHHLAG